MTFDWQAVITALGGDAILLGFAAWLFKQLVSNRLTMEAEKFKIELKAQTDTEIERLKASLTRGSRIHERQLDILQKLYRHLDDAQGLLQRMTSGGRMGNELSPEEYAPKVDEAIRAAWDEFSNGRLFLPTPLIQECETFFATVFEGKRNFAFANLPALNPIQRAEFWKTAGEVAYKQVPEILKRIDEASRAVIYG